MHRQDFFRRVGALEDSVEAILFEFQARLEYFFTVLPAASQNVRVLCRFILFFWKAPPRFFSWEWYAGARQEGCRLCLVFYSALSRV